MYNAFEEDEEFNGGLQNLPPPDISRSESAYRGGLDAITFGAAPKISAAIGAGIMKAMDPSRDYSEMYQKGRDFLRQQNRMAADANPWSYAGGGLAGGVLGPGKFMSGVNTVSGAAKVGAGYGMLYGLGSSDKGDVGSLNAVNVYDALGSGFTGGVLGGAGQGLINYAAVPAYRAMMASKFNPYKSVPLPTPNGAPMPQDALGQKGLALSEQFGVPISKGQATQDTVQQVAEDLMASGAKGSEAAAIMNAQRSGQRQAFQDRALALQQDIGGGRFIEKGQSIMPAAKKLMTQAEIDNQAKTAAYDLAKSKIGFLNLKDVKQFTGIAKAKLAEEAMTPANAPLSFKQLESFESTFGKMPKKTGVDFRTVEAYRQGLNRAFSAAQGQDKWGIGVLKTQLDDHLDNIVESALIKGDTSVLDQFKKARLLNAQYRQNYFTKDKTAFGKKFVQDIVENGENYTPAMVSDKLWGASKYGFKQEAISGYNELKNRLGAQSPEFQGLKLDAVHKVLKPLIQENGEISFNNPAIQTFKNNLYEQESVLKNMLSPDEFKQLSDFGDLGSLLFQSRKSVVNPSQSGLFKTISELPLIKQALGVSGRVADLPLVREIPEAYNAYQAKSSFDPKSITAAVTRQAQGGAAPVAESVVAPAAALGGTALVETLSVPPKTTQQILEQGGQSQNRQGRLVNITREQAAAELQRRNQLGGQEQGQNGDQIRQTPAISREQAMQELERRNQLGGQPTSQNQEVVNPTLLNKIAYVESGNNPNARASTSSASGVYQFTNGTWRDVVNKYGAQTGIGYGDKNNPRAQRIMAELMLKDNAQELKSFLGRDARPTEVYLTHFLGVGGAKKFLSSHPDQLAFKVLPEAAQANRTIFYNNGRPRTVREVYLLMNTKIGKAKR
jgi:hypothetical protein